MNEWACRLSARRTTAGPDSAGAVLAAVEASFAEVVGLIEQARLRAYQAVNTELVGLYWQIGEYISGKLVAADWGEGVVDSLAQHLARTVPGQRGFTRRNLFRMRQFFETYRNDAKVTPLVTQLPWTHNLIILSQAQRPEAREFYLRMAVQERWSKRQLERQFRLGAFERAVLDPPKLSAALREMQVGGRDFTLDLLFFHRGLNCLVAVELKVERFEPEHLGKLNFYLEALDRDVRKAHENPAIGVLLCASKDSEVVEYALSRTLSPALVAQYQTQLPDKKLLATKLHEFYALNAPEAAAPAVAASRKSNRKSQK